MRTRTIICLLICLTPSLSLGNQEDPALNSATQAITEAQSFLSWLDQHKTDFSACQPTKKGPNYELCDGTQIPEAALKSLFKLAPASLTEFIQSKQIKLEILCKDSPRNTFSKWCTPNINRKFFKEVSSLHGQFIPEENTIVLHSDALPGSMVHEYLHYLQFTNANKVFGHTYKSERVLVQHRLLSALDGLINKVKQLEPLGDKSALKPYLPPAMQITNLMMAFSFWQKLIDERNLFLLYAKYSKPLGIKIDDVALAKKNMGFLCKDQSIAKELPKSECPTSK